MLLAGQHMMNMIVVALHGQQVDEKSELPGCPAGPEPVPATYWLAKIQGVLGGKEKV